MKKILRCLHITMFLLSIMDMHARQKATVRIGNELCNDEELFLQKRMPHVKAALEEFIGTSLEDDEVPRIAVCCSGGGYRAMLATLGSFQGVAPTLESATHKNLFHHMLTYVTSLFTFTSGADQQFQTPVQSNLGLLSLCTHASTLSGSTWALACLLHSHRIS